MIRSVPGGGEGNKETLCLTHTTKPAVPCSSQNPSCIWSFTNHPPHHHRPRPNTALSTVHFPDLFLSQIAFTGNAHRNSSLHYVCVPTPAFIFGPQPYSTHSLGFALGCYPSWWYHLHLSGRPSNWCTSIIGMTTFFSCHLILGKWLIRLSMKHSLKHASS